MFKRKLLSLIFAFKLFLVSIRTRPYIYLSLTQFGRIVNCSSQIFPQFKTDEMKPCPPVFPPDESKNEDEDSGASSSRGGRSY